MPCDTRVPHPEVAIGIPTPLVCFQRDKRSRLALAMGYRGPLTLADAVAQGRITVEYAEQVRHMWLHATHRQFEWMPVPEIVPEAWEQKRREDWR